MTAKGQNEVLFYAEFLNFVWWKRRVQVRLTPSWLLFPHHRQGNTRMWWQTPAPPPDRS